MKIPKIFALLALPLASVLASPQAHADTYGPLQFTVWIGTDTGGVDFTADTAGIPTVASTATFTYSGPLDFVNNDPNNANNTFLNLFGAANEADITGLSGITLASLNSMLLSTPGETGSATNSFFEITGTATGNTKVTISSDDGSSLYLGGTGVSNEVAGLFFPAPQSDSTNTSTSTVNAGTGTAFTLDYVESNGSPSDLVVTGLAPAPEPSGLVLLGTGVLAAAGVVRRRIFA